MKPVRMSRHAISYMTSRGFTQAEVEQAIRTEPWEAGDLGRVQCRKDFSFGRVWNGKRYPTKQVRPIFVEEPTEIVVVTVYTYYF